MAETNRDKLEQKLKEGGDKAFKEVKEKQKKEKKEKDNPPK